MASVRSYKKLPPCLINPVSAGSKVKLPPLAKVKPISEGGSASGITYLRREKNCGEMAVGERSETR